MIQTNIIIPSSMLQYQCSQSGRCCGGWIIGLNSSSYNRLKDVLTTNNKSKLFKKYVKKSPDKTLHYATIKFENDQCGFLEKSGLCAVHKDFGIHTLPDICQVFPRLVFKTPFGKELSITFACPNAAELLKDKNKITKIKNPKDFFFAHGNLYYGSVAHDIFESTDLKKYYQEVEDHLIEIIQTRHLSIEERLILMGMTSRRLEALENPSFEDVQNIFNIDKKILSQDFLKEELKKINPDISHQVYLLKEFIYLRLDNIPNEELLNIFTNLIDTFQFSEEEDDEDLNISVEKYLRYYDQYFKPNEKEIEHIFENFLVYLILRKIFIRYSLSKAYYLSIYFFSLIRLTAIGLAVSQDKIVDEDIAVKAVWVIERAIGHSYQFYTNILDFLMEKDLATIPHAISLLKIPEKQLIK